MIIEHEQDEQSAQWLAKANLFRIRHQWDEAITCCMHVLYNSPDSWSAHALVGDIYADQDRPEEAIQWYCMTLDIRPDAQSVRDKLSQVVNSRRREIVHAIDPTRPYTTRDGRTFPSSRLGKLAWYWSAPERKRLFWAASVILVLVILVLVPSLVAPHTNSGSSGAMFTNGSTPTTTTIKFQPVTPQGANSGVEQSTGAAAPTLGGQQAANTGTHPAGSTAVPAIRDPSDQSITDALANDASLKAQGIFVTDAQLQPATSGLIVTFVSTAPPAPTAQVREMRDCLSVARTALGLQQTANVLSCTLRCLASPAGQTSSDVADSSGAGQTQVLSYTGTIGRDSISSEGGDPSNLGFSQLNGLFTDVWWQQSSTPAS